MRSRKVDSVKIVLTLEREHENQGLRGCETCSKTIEIDVQMYAKSRMQFGSYFYRTFDRFFDYFFTILGGILVSKKRVGKNIEKKQKKCMPRRASRTPWGGFRRGMVRRRWWGRRRSSTPSSSGGMGGRIVYASRIPPRPLGDWIIGCLDDWMFGWPQGEKIDRPSVFRENLQVRGMQGWWIGGIGRIARIGGIDGKIRELEDWSMQ